MSIINRQYMTVQRILRPRTQESSADWKLTMTIVGQLLAGCDERPAQANVMSRYQFALAGNLATSRAIGGTRQ